MIEVTDFEQQVLQGSYAKPVLVDFWAPWCGPCRQLGPVLERLEAEEGAAFTLAKLNTDKDPTTSGRYAVQSIPAVKLFVDGQVVDEFVGALPEARVRSWLEGALPSETRRLVLLAKTLMESGRQADAEPLLAEALRAEPENVSGALLLARVSVFRDPERAAILVRNASQLDPADYDLREAILAVVQLSRVSVDELEEDAAREGFVQGLEALGNESLDDALSAFVQSTRLNRRYRDESARRACVAIFTILGKDDPLTRKHRRALEAALF